MSKRLTVLYLVAAAVGFSPAAASDPRITQFGSPALAITTADLDLTTVDGRAQLDRRILRAATALCTPEPNLSPSNLPSPAPSAARDTCIKETVEGARDLRTAAIRQQRDRNLRTADASRP
jgi:UrcA family protein